ncbi:AbrB/MazE/SpoVT family DNA-binding domain-containing protein [bacterium]|nr:AbrB/MazE/SpoVT family DNA-binding domain-containing protein [bacterium]MBU4561355.1 AbrB/MazE/SpoVT family DNA-binding domain-containing protein [bacterium]
MTVLTLRKNAQLTLPKRVREALNLHEGDLIEMKVKDKKVILTPQMTIDSEQAWFWVKEWQKKEARAEADIKAGRVKKFSSAKELMKELEK